MPDTDYEFPPPVDEPTPDEQAAAKPRRKRAKPDADPAPPSPRVFNPLEWPFKFLGYNDSVYYYLPHSSRQIVPLGACQHTRLNLMQLAHSTFWLEKAATSKYQVDWEQCAEACMAESRKVGIFDPAIIRGRGCWLDKDRFVFHTGRSLLVDGVQTQLAEIQSDYCYEHRIDLKYQPVAPATAAQGKQVLNLIKMLNWKTQMAAPLIAGWCFIAPICGVLLWRPHVWVSGVAKSGKSWIINNIVGELLGEHAIRPQGSTSEAGLRQHIQSETLPVLYDEAESNDPLGMERMQKILELIRSSSSTGKGQILRGTQHGKPGHNFLIQSCFCLASIGVAAVDIADISRITVCELYRRPESEREAHFKAVSNEALCVLTPGFSAAIRARSMHMARTVLQNAAVFTEAVAIKLGDRRQGDQFGTLLAGAYSLAADGVVSLPNALAWVEKQDWLGFMNTESDADESKATNLLLAHHVRVDPVRTFDVGQLIGFARRRDESDLKTMAKSHLTLLGMRVDTVPGREGLHLYVSASHPRLTEIYRMTPWAKKWKHQFLRLTGATELTNYRFGSINSRAVAVPLDSLVTEDGDSKTAWPSEVNPDDA